MKNNASFIGFFSNPLIPNGCKISKGDALSQEILRRFDPDATVDVPEYFQEYCIEVPDLKVALTILSYTFRKYSLGKDLYMIPVKTAFETATMVLDDFFKNKTHRMLELEIQAVIESTKLDILEKEIEAEEKAKKRK